MIHSYWKDESESESDSDEGDEGEDDVDEEDLSEQEAARMMEKVRIAEEDDEFERAFKSVVQVAVFK